MPRVQRPLPATPLSEIANIVSEMRRDFYTARGDDFPPCLQWRQQQLRQIRRMMLEHQDRWEDALERDLRSNRLLKMYEVRNCVADVDLMLNNLRAWARPQTQPNTMAANLGAQCVVYREPYGVVLIMSAWNCE